MILIIWLKNRLKLILSLFLVFWIHIAFSQNGSTSIGLKAGYGVSRYYFLLADKGQISQQFMPVYQAGLVFSQISNNNKLLSLGLQWELNYTQKGWIQTFTTSPQEYKVNMNTLEMPVLTHFRFGKKKVSFFMNMGLHLTYILNSQIDSAGVTISDKLIQYADTLVNTFDYGLDGGIGLEFGKERGIFQVQVMYSQGLRNIIDRDKQEKLLIYRSLNQNLFLSCIYKIPLNKRKKS